VHLASVLVAESRDIGVRDNVINVENARSNHMRNRVSACSANSENHYFSRVFEVIGYVKSIIIIVQCKSHNSISSRFISPRLEDADKRSAETAVKILSKIGISEQHIDKIAYKTLLYIITYFYRNCNRFL